MDQSDRPFSEGAEIGAAWKYASDKGVGGSRARATRASPHPSAPNSYRPGSPDARLAPSLPLRGPIASEAASGLGRSAAPPQSGEPLSSRFRGGRPCRAPTRRRARTAQAAGTSMQPFPRAFRRHPRGPNNADRCRRRHARVRFGPPRATPIASKSDVHDDGTKEDTSDRPILDANQARSIAKGPIEARRPSTRTPRNYPEIDHVG